MAAFLNRPLEMCMQIEQHSHGECEAKFACSDYARGVLTERAYEMCNFPFSVLWQVHSEDDIVLWFPATELICVEVVWLWF